MKTNEYWHNNNVFVNISTNGRIGVTLYYGSSRQYAIKTSGNIKPDTKKQVREMVRKLKEAKKWVTPLHGCTEYV